MAVQFRFGCAICSDAFDIQQMVCAALCGHIYHAACLMRWLRTQVQSERPPTCPKCRASVRRQHLRRLFLHQVDATPANSPQPSDADTVIIANETDSEDDSVDGNSDDMVSNDGDEEIHSEDTMSVASDDNASTVNTTLSEEIDEMMNADLPSFLASM